MFHNRKKTDKSALYARFSNIAYEADVGKRRQMAGDLGYQIDESLSGAKHVTFHKDGKGVVAYRGTKPTDSEDLISDAAIGIGAEDKNKRFQDSLNIADQAAQKYGTVEFTGHSLGGSIAKHVSKKRKYSSTVFNPGVSPFDFGSEPVNTVTYKNKFDVISSGLAKSFAPIAVAGAVTGAHKLEQFY